MRTYSMVKGVSVYDQETGSKMGEVTDLKLKGTKVEGLLVKQGNLLKKVSQLELTDIYSYGPDGIFIDHKASLKPCKKADKRGFSRELAGKFLLSTDGQQLGLLEDVYFSEEVGTIVGYECSDGFFSDISEGKQIIQTESPLQFGKDAIIVNVKNLSPDHRKET